MIPGGQLETERLVVRPFIPGDVVALVAMFADPLVRRYVDDGRPLDEPTARLWIRRSAENLARFGYGTGAVVLRKSGAVIGWAGVARPGDGSEELIYGLVRDRWGKGLGGELLAGLIGFAAQRGIDPVRATVDPANVRSIALLVKAGFVRAEPGGDSHLYLRYRSAIAEDGR